MRLNKNKKHLTIQMDKEHLTQKELEALKQIRNYWVYNGKFPSIRKLMLAMGYTSPRSASLLIQKLNEKGLLKHNKNKKYQIVDNPLNFMCAQTVDVPLVGTAACETPIFAEQNIEMMIPVSNKLLTPGNKYFILRAKGDSMNEVGINDKDLILVKQKINANNGDKIVALIDNEATIKEFHYTKDFIILKPRSTNPIHKPIILTNDFQIQGIVISVLPNVFFKD